MAHLSEHVEFDVQWLPFQLNPQASKSGVNKLQMYMDKFGRSREGTLEMAKSMAGNFANVGLPFKFTDQAMTGNTFNAHRLISYANHKGGAAMQDKVVEELFLNYFGQEQFINNPQVLLAAAMKMGLSQQEARSFVTDETQHAAETTAELGVGKGKVSGVPFFIFNAEGSGRQATVSGAQDPGALIAVINSILTRDCPV